MQPKKALGQNFLMHRKIAERIVMAAGVTDQDIVLEIGPGTGMLTRPLLTKAKKVIAIETDDDLIPQLEREFAHEIAANKLVVLHEDVRLFDSSSIEESYKVVANIPYYITGELIRQFLTGLKKPTSITFLVQKEVAERIARSKKESLLSVSVKIFGIPKYQFTVPKGAFFPAPTVDSAVLSITDIHSPFDTTADELQFFEIVRAGFAHKRKQLAGNLAEIFSLDAISTALEAANLPRTIRAEDVSISAWRLIVNYLTKNSSNAHI